MEEIAINLANYFNSKGINQKEVAEKLDTSTAYVNAILNNRKAIGKKQAQKIENLFGISSAWLLTGRGNMLLDDIPTVDAEEVDDSGSYIPLLPIVARGGSVDEFSDAINERDCERIKSPIAGAELAIPVYGDSMEPGIPSGSVVLIKRIFEDVFIEWGAPHVLDTRNGSVLKNLMPSENKGKIRCESNNPKFPPFEISKEEIHGIYRVLMCMSMKV